MRYALLDNATLTAIERLLGGIPVKNTAIVDADILAFENYVQAILFYDYIIAIDDYIPKYSDSRKAMFPDIRFISTNLFEYQEFQNESSKITEAVKLKIKAGEINSEEYKKFFKSLAMRMTFTWDLSASDHYLTQKLLVNTENGKSETDNFDKIHSAIISEAFGHFGITDKEKTIEPILYDRNGNIINPRKSYGGLSYPFILFTNGLNWISHRTSMYILIADYLNADAFLSPIRQKYSDSILNHIIKRSTGKFSTLINNYGGLVTKSLIDIKQADESCRISSDLPLFSAYLANKTNDVSKIIEAAYNIREQPEFIECRLKLRELNKVLDSGAHSKYVADINLLKKEIASSLEKIKGKFNVANKGIKFSTLAMIWNMTPLSQYLKMPKFNTKIESLDFLNHTIKGRGFSRVSRNIIDDLANVKRLGSLYDILAKNVDYKKDASYYAMKTEEEKYKNASSGWKIPMR